MQVNVHEKLDAVIDQIAALKAHLDEVSDLHWEAHTREHIAAERTQGHTNELLNDVRMRFIPREVFEGFSRVTAESVNRMNDRLSQLEGRFLGVGGGGGPQVDALGPCRSRPCHRVAVRRRRDCECELMPRYPSAIWKPTTKCNYGGDKTHLNMGGGL